MLEKIIRIKNVGKFKDCAARGDVTFRPLTLIYGENGRGKTTFCDILRSLQTGDAELISGRGTLGAADEPVVELLAGTNVTFKDGAWSATNPDIAIFDDTFVYDNVHAGEFVQHDQKRGLYGVIIGATGVQLQKQVDALDAQSRDVAKTLKTAQATLKAHLPRGFAEAAFLGLTADPDIDDKITAQQAVLKRLEHAAAIKTRPALTELTQPAFPGDILATLSATLESLEADTEARVRTHLEDHTNQATQAWIADGLAFKKGDTCPFCSQDTSDVTDLLSAYQVCFGELFDNLRTQVVEMQAEVDRVGGEAATQAIQHRLDQNSHALEFWQQFLDLTPPAFPFDQIKQALTDYATAAKTLLDKKATALLQQIEGEEKLVTMQRCTADITGAFTAYNDAVAAANREIEQLKTTTEGTDATQATNDLARLEATKHRFTPAVDAACQAVLGAKDDKRRVEKAKRQAKTALDQHGNTVLPQFQGLINTLLENFGVGFRIQNVERSFAGGKPSTSYQLLINHVPVELGDSSTSKAEPSFRNTLSAGDRRTLALAFFIAQLQLDPAVGDKTVVFDDPFTSQDSSRRMCTQQQLCRLAREAHQVIVLSHEARFLADVHTAFPDKSLVKTLQLARVGMDANLIQEWNINDATLSAYQLDQQTLLAFVNDNHGAARDVAKAIRPMLEGYLRFVCPASFPEGEWLGDFIKRIREADNTDPANGFSVVLGELEDVNYYAKRYHHITNPVADTEPIDNGELGAYAKRALKLVGAPPQT